MVAQSINKMEIESLPAHHSSKAEKVANPISANQDATDQEDKSPFRFQRINSRVLLEKTQEEVTAVASALHDMLEDAVRGDAEEGKDNLAEQREDATDQVKPPLLFQRVNSRVLLERTQEEVTAAAAALHEYVKASTATTATENEEQEEHPDVTPDEDTVRGEAEEEKSSTDAEQRDDATDSNKWRPFFLRARNIYNSSIGACAPISTHTCTCNDFSEIDAYTCADTADSVETAVLTRVDSTVDVMEAALLTKIDETERSVFGVIAPKDTARLNAMERSLSRLTMADDDSFAINESPNGSFDNIEADRKTIPTSIAAKKVKKNQKLDAAWKAAKVSPNRKKDKKKKLNAAKVSPAPSNCKKVKKKKPKAAKVSSAPPTGKKVKKKKAAKVSPAPSNDKNVKKKKQKAAKVSPAPSTKKNIKKKNQKAAKVPPSASSAAPPTGMKVEQKKLKSARPCGPLALYRSVAVQIIDIAPQKKTKSTGKKVAPPPFFATPPTGKKVPPPPFFAASRTKCKLGTTKKSGGSSADYDITQMASF